MPILSDVWCCLHDTGGGTHPLSLRLRPTFVRLATGLLSVFMHEATVLGSRPP